MRLARQIRPLSMLRRISGRLGANGEHRAVSPKVCHSQDEQGAPRAQASNFIVNSCRSCKNNGSSVGRGCSAATAADDELSIRAAIRTLVAERRKQRMARPLLMCAVRMGKWKLVSGC